MFKNITIIVVSAVLSVTASVLLMPLLGPAGKPQMSGGGSNAGAVQQRLKQQQERVWAMVIADIEKYGFDIYRLYSDVSRSNSMIPGSDFGADKSLKKLSVTYPDSNIYKLAVAWDYRKCLRDRDMLQIEKAISEIPADGSSRLMPNGLELEPLLYMAMFNYQQSTGRHEAAGKIIAILEEKYGDCLIDEEQKITTVKDWLVQQKAVHNAIMKFQKADKL